MSSEIYQLQLKNGFCETLNGKDFAKSNFDAAPDKYVIYIMRKGETIFYVGQAGRGLHRCLDGFTAKSSQPISYSWRSDSDIKDSKIEVLVAYSFLKNSLAQKRSAREIVEADVTAKIFSLSNSWPSKLRQLTVRGNVERNTDYKNALKKVVEELEKNSWL